MTTTNNTHAAKTARQIATMKTLTFGVEIETMGQRRDIIANAICRVVGGRVMYHGGTYDMWKVVDARGRTWKVMTDASIRAPRDLQAEIVSPVLRYEDMEEFQEVVRAVRRARAKVDPSCGIHVHIGADRFDAAALSRLVKVVAKDEALIEHALGISPARRMQWCRRVSDRLLEKIAADRPRTLEAMNEAWYGRRNAYPAHYDPSRYHGLNLHNVWFRGTVEFRWFETTLHAGKVKAYVQLCLALGAKALNARSASAKRREVNPQTARYDFRVCLLNLGLIGDEFKTARTHLLARLAGDSRTNGRGQPRGRRAAPVAAETAAA